jgi:type III restriction enzyme
MFFGGFKRCLFSKQKFQSDTERKLAIILDREATKWFKPAKGQFQIYYKLGIELPEYVPDFVVETDKCIFMMEPKARNDMESAEVQAKKDAAVKWCAHATKHSTENGGKPWKYVLLPHDAIMENMSVSGLVNQYAC